MYRATSRIATEESQIMHKPNNIGLSIQGSDENVLTSMYEIEDMSDLEEESKEIDIGHPFSSNKKSSLKGSFIGAGIRINT